MQLAELKPGMSGVVTSVAGSGRIASRLMELGMVPGAIVDVLRKAPFGDPVQYRVRGALISMRAAEAACVTVSAMAGSTLVAG
jgi:ferrous iron transport protein A